MSYEMIRISELAKELGKSSKEILEKSYNYTTEKIYKGYLKSGGKRNV